MAKTAKERLTDLICELLEFWEGSRGFEQTHIVVRKRQLEFVSTTMMIPGDTYVMKAANRRGNRQSRRKVKLYVSVLDRFIALTPLLKH